jgi:hypothetical protein
MTGVLLEPMHAITIDHDVPVPRKRSKYPFTEMKVGDSFLIPSGF